MSYAPSSAEVREHVRLQVAIAAQAPGEITEATAYLFGLDEDAVAPLVEEALRDRERAVAGWPPVTDCDRLDAAFIDLERSGVIARQHFTCCNTCGHAEIHDHVHDALERGRRADGYVFYHWQDTEHAVTGGSLHLRYSADIGPRVVEALRAHGFAPAWDGDAARTIQVPIAWMRRAWRRHTPPAATPHTLLTRWCEAIASTSLADLAAALQGSYPLALVEAGCLDAAFAWARAPLTGSGALTRSSTLATLATSLPGRMPADRIDDVWIEAFACVPYGRDTALVELLWVMDPTRPAVRAAARARTFNARDDLYGAAAVGWYHACVAEPVDDRVIARLQRHLDRVDDRLTSDRPARAALAAAMWILRTRRGEPADAACAIATDSATAAGDRGFAEAAMAHARTLLGDPGPVAPIAPVTLEDAGARLATVREGYDEGLYTAYELREARLDVARCAAAGGDLARARAMLAEIATESRGELIAIDRAIHAFVEAVRAGTRGPELLVTDVDPAALDKAIARWTAATDRRARLRARRAGTLILQAATAIARRDRHRGRDLAALVLDHEDSLGYLDGAAVATAWIMLGDLDRAIERAEHGSGEASGPVAVALAQQSRTGEAIALLDNVVHRVRHRDEVAALAPAILAIAADPQSAAATLLDAWAHADAGLAALSP